MLTKLFEGLLSCCCLANAGLCLLLYYMRKGSEEGSSHFRLKLMLSFLTGLSLVFMALAKLTMINTIKDAQQHYRKLAADIALSSFLLLPHPCIWSSGVTVTLLEEDSNLDDLLTACVLLRIVLLSKIIFKSLSYYGTRYRPRNLELCGSATSSEAT